MFPLRVITTNPVGASYMKRCWPVHYVIGWMGAYITDIFGDKVRRPEIPSYHHLPKKSMMVNMMFWIPKYFSPAEAFNPLWHYAKITTSFGLPRSQILRTNRGHPHQHGSTKHFVYLSFVVCFLSGMLACALLSHTIRIVWLANSDDQMIPYPPLTILYIEEDFGIAYKK